MMNTIKYYSGNVELNEIRPMLNAQFAAAGFAQCKHNRYDSFSRLTGKHDGKAMPVTRIVEFKRSAKPHKCDERCTTATGNLCSCSCGGKNHGLER